MLENRSKHGMPRASCFLRDDHRRLANRRDHFHFHPDRPLKTNVEFYAAPVLQGVGLTPDLFPAAFALSRTAGWTAHVLEQSAANRLIRPDANYIGPAERDLP